MSKYHQPSRRPVVVVYREPAATRSAAARREYQIKQMTRSGKQELITAALPNAEVRRQKADRRKAEVESRKAKVSSTKP